MDKKIGVIVVIIVLIIALIAGFLVFNPFNQSDPHTVRAFGATMRSLRKTA